jgi:hypothetical protein
MYGIRSLLHRVGEADPFPDAAGEAYLGHCLAWFLAHDPGRWPPWAWQAMGQLLISPDDSRQPLPWVPPSLRKALQADAQRAGPRGRVPPRRNAGKHSRARDSNVSPSASATAAASEPLAMGEGPEAGAPKPGPTSWF